MTTKPIHIKGAPREYSEVELNQLQEQRKSVYQFTENYIHVKEDLAYNFIKLIIEKEKEGYVLCNKTPIITQPLSFRARMIKPQEIQDQELAVIYEEVKAKYIADLQKEREDYKKLLVQQLVEAEEEKERKRAEQAKAKKLAEFEQQANDCFKELVIPE